VEIIMTFCRYILHPFSILFAFGLALILGCDPKVAGSISETGNGGVAGAIVDQNGVSAGRTQVKLIPVDYDPVKDTAAISIDTTDSQGKYAFSKIDAGDYVVLAHHLDKKTSVLIKGIHVGEDTCIVAPDTLKLPGSIKTMLPSNANAANGYVYIPGSGISKFLDDQNDFVILDSVPSGAISALLYSSTNSTEVNVIRYGVRVLPQDTTLIWNPVWKYNRKFILNTSSSGANVTGAVTDFPVLIRLNSDNFDFSEAKPTGADIRFTKPDNTFLHYEIERWDSGNKLAEIWVKVDTVRGGDSTQSLLMYWGNDKATDSSNSMAVFDTTNGFQGVWHLGETDSLASDATANRYNGTGYFTSPVDGMIGSAQHFNGVSSYIRMKGTAPQSRLNFPMDGHYMVSAWVNHDTLADSMAYLIAGKGEHQYFIKNFDLALSTPQHQHQWEFTEFHENNIWHAVTFSPTPAKTWSYLVGIRDGSNQYLYIDGALVMEGYKLFGTGNTVTPRDTSDDFSIGAFLHPTSDWNQGYAYFQGTIDEVNVSSMPRSADWIKLCYMNQKKPDALVKW
jgi:hypothetical protein